MKLIPQNAYPSKWQRDFTCINYACPESRFFWVNKWLIVEAESVIRDIVVEIGSCRFGLTSNDECAQRFRTCVSMATKKCTIAGWFRMARNGRGPLDVTVVVNDNEVAIPFSAVDISCALRITGGYSGLRISDDPYPDQGKRNMVIYKDGRPVACLPQMYSSNCIEKSMQMAIRESETITIRTQGIGIKASRNNAWRNFWADHLRRRKTP